MSAIDLPEDDEIPEDAAKRLRELPPINIYRVLGIVPQTVIPWSDMVRALYECELAPRLREIAVCRQAVTANAPYELHQHLIIAANNGVSETELRAVQEETPVVSLDAQANLVCRAAEEIERTATLSDTTFAEVHEAFGRQGTMELILLVSFYSAVARLANASRLTLESGNPLKDSTNPNAPS